MAERWAPPAAACTWVWPRAGDTGPGPPVHCPDGEPRPHPTHSPHRAIGDRHKCPHQDPGPGPLGARSWAKRPGWAWRWARPSQGKNQGSATRAEDSSGGRGPGQGRATPQGEEAGGRSCPGRVLGPPHVGRLTGWVHSWPGGAAGRAPKSPQGNGRGDSSVSCSLARLPQG